MRNLIFYGSYYEAIKELPEDMQGRIYKAIIDYAMESKTAELSGFEKSVFVLIKPTLDASIKNYENGKKGGRPAKNNPKENPNESQDISQIKTETETQTKPNENPTHNPSERENEKENDKEKLYITDDKKYIKNKVSVRAREGEERICQIDIGLKEPLFIPVRTHGVATLDANARESVYYDLQEKFGSYKFACKTSYKETETFDFVFRVIASCCALDADIVYGGTTHHEKKISQEDLWLLVKNMDEQVLGKILTSFYEIKDRQWVKRKISDPVALILTILENCADE